MYLLFSVINYLLSKGKIKSPSMFTARSNLERNIDKYFKSGDLYDVELTEQIYESLKSYLRPVANCVYGKVKQNKTYLKSLRSPYELVSKSNSSSNSTYETTLLKPQLNILDYPKSDYPGIYAFSELLVMYIIEPPESITA